MVTKMIHDLITILTIQILSKINDNFMLLHLLTINDSYQSS